MLELHAHGCVIEAAAVKRPSSRLLVRTDSQVSVGASTKGRAVSPLLLAELSRSLPNVFLGDMSTASGCPAPRTPPTTPRAVAPSVSRRSFFRLSSWFGDAASGDVGSFEAVYRPALGVGSPDDLPPSLEEALPAPRPFVEDVRVGKRRAGEGATEGGAELPMLAGRGAALRALSPRTAVRPRAARGRRQWQPAGLGTVVVGLECSRLACALVQRGARRVARRSWGFLVSSAEARREVEALIG